MTGIVAAMTNRVDSGVIFDTKKCFQLSADRGHLGERIVILPHHGDPIVVLGGASGLSLALNKVALNEEELIVLGVTRSSFQQELGESGDGAWFVAIDGAVANMSGTDVANAIAAKGFRNAAREFTGQFALVAANANYRRLYWANKAKPLYGLFGDVRASVRIVSQREYFTGMYHPTRTTSPVELGPYACGTITPEGIVEEHDRYERYRGSGTVILAGGGLDSLVTAFAVKRAYGSEPLSLLFCDYGQRALDQERNANGAIAAAVGATDIHIVPLPIYGPSSALTGGYDVSHRPVRGVASEWVPFRNTLFASLGLSFAEAKDYARVALGINAEAAVSYPDNEQEWLKRLRYLTPYALGVDREVELFAPLSGLSKHEIVKLGKKHSIPWSDIPSWSCYEGGEKHCGTCSSCRARRQAFKDARVADTTEYAR